MDSRESREFRRFEGIREDRGKARAQAPLAKQVQFRGKRPPKSACKRSFKRHKTVPGTGLKAGPFGLRASSNCSTQTCLPSTTKTTENFQKLQFKTKNKKNTAKTLQNIQLLTMQPCNAAVPLYTQIFSNDSTLKNKWIPRNQTDQTSTINNTYNFLTELKTKTRPATTKSTTSVGNSDTESPAQHAVLLAKGFQ